MNEEFERALDEILENSYRNFHARGVDYICLKRSPEHTVKIYMFDGDVSKVPEVVNPHDHRYDFDTLVPFGSLENIVYGQTDFGAAPVYTAFEWHTPLNGGDGFRYAGETRLLEMTRRRYDSRDGGRYFSRAETFHTIRMLENETLMVLHQYEDVVPIGRGTTTFVPGVDGEAPSLSGLYDRWKKDDLVSRLKWLQDRSVGLLFPDPKDPKRG